MRESLGEGLGRGVVAIFISIIARRRCFSLKAITLAFGAQSDN